MKEFIVTGTQKGRSNSKVRVFAQNKHDASNKAMREHGFTSIASVQDA